MASLTLTSKPLPTPGPCRFNQTFAGRDYTTATESVRGVEIIRGLFLSENPPLERLRTLRKDIVERGVYQVYYGHRLYTSNSCIELQDLDAILHTNFGLAFPLLERADHWHTVEGHVPQGYNLMLKKAVPLEIDRLSLEERLEHLYLIVMANALPSRSIELPETPATVLGRERGGVIDLCFAFSPARFEVLSNRDSYDPPLSVEERSEMEPIKLFNGVVWTWHIGSEERWQWVVNLIVRNKRAQVGIACRGVASLSLLPPRLLPLIISYLPLDEGLPECPFGSDKLRAFLSRVDRWSTLVPSKC